MAIKVFIGHSLALPVRWCEAVATTGLHGDLMVTGAASKPDATGILAEHGAITPVEASMLMRSVVMRYRRSLSVDAAALARAGIVDLATPGVWAWDRMGKAPFIVHVSDGSPQRVAHWVIRSHVGGTLRAVAL